MTIFVQCFCNREPAGVSRDQIQEVFGSYLTIEKLNKWYLYYDELTYCNVTISPLKENKDLIHNLSINGGGEKLFDALFSILQLGHVVLYYPGCKAPIAVDVAVAKQLPQDMIGVLGMPVKVCSGAETLKIIQAN